MEHTTAKRRKAHDILTTIATEFGTTKFTKKFARSYIDAPVGPSEKWSITNRLCIRLQDTNDARGYKQWQEVGRRVKKGAKAIHILGPRYMTIPKKEAQKEGKPDTYKKMIGFFAIPVFRYEDTDGKPLPQYKPKNQPHPDLMKLIKKRDIKLEWKNTIQGEGGYVQPAANQIVLCSEDFEVLAHELVHMYDNDTNKLKNGQDPIQETVAELGACVLGQIYGHDIRGQAYQYIASYADSHSPEQVGKMCLKVVTRVGNVLDRIFEGTD